MNIKRMLCSFLAATMLAGLVSVSAFASSERVNAPVTMPKSGSAETGKDLEDLYILRSDRKEIETVGKANNFSAWVPEEGGRVRIEGIVPGQTFYIWLGEDGESYPTITNNDTTVYPEDLADKDLWKIKLDKSGDGANLIESITQVSNKSITLPGHQDSDTKNRTDRGSWLKVNLKDSLTTEELKAKIVVTFTAKKDAVDEDGKKNTNLPKSDSDYLSGDKAELLIELWINNTKIKGTDADVDGGDRIYFDPTSGDENIMTWNDEDDEIASLQFDADSDTEEFYARLSTKVDNSIYSKYGDPVNADLFFFDFVSNPKLPSTSRAVLTLGYPWDDDDDSKDDEYLPDPAQCYIYLVDSEGFLQDVTSQFTYSEDDYDIAGWSAHVRQLGTYVISDVKLDI